MKTRVYLIRHGEYDQEENTQLTESGLQQAKKLCSLLKDKNITEIISSPILRAKKTAYPLAEELDLTIEENSAFTEFFPDKETFDEALQRVQEGIDEVVQAYEGRSIAVFSHGFTVGEFLIAIEYGTREDLPIGSVKSGAYAEIIYENGKYSVKDTYRIDKR